MTKKTIEEKKLQIISDCAKMLSSASENNGNKSLSSPFAMYVEEKLLSFDKRTRLIAEKRISDVIFDLEFDSSMNFAYTQPTFYKHE
jgi:hypothetical protein